MEREPRVISSGIQGRGTTSSDRNLRDFFADTSSGDFDFIQYCRRAGSRKDYIHFLFIARGSAYEVEAQIIACADLNLIDRNTLKKLYAQTLKVIRLLNALIKALQKSEKNSLTEEIMPYGEEAAPDTEWEALEIKL